MKTPILLLAGTLALGMAAMPPATRIEMPAGAHHPVLSPNGTALLFSTDTHTGLNILDLSTGNIRQIDPSAGVGFQPVFSLDGSTVYYRSAEVRDGLMMRDVRSCRTEENAQPAILADYSREKVDLHSLAGGDYALADYRTIKVTHNGVATVVDPLADSHSYLWASLSPDGSRLLFTEPFKGVYVANADGTEPRRILAKGDFASWAGNNRIVAVVTHDDGYVVLDSKLVLVNIATGITTELTADDVKVGETTASAAGKVVYTDLAGNMYMIDLNEL